MLANHTTSTTTLILYMILKSSLIVDWSVDNVNPDMTPIQEVIRCYCQCITKDKEKKKYKI